MPDPTTASQIVEPNNVSAKQHYTSAFPRNNIALVDLHKITKDNINICIIVYLNQRVAAMGQYGYCVASRSICFFMAAYSHMFCSMPRDEIYLGFLNKNKTYPTVIYYLLAKM
jgi:hypothetical protein